MVRVQHHTIITSTIHYYYLHRVKIGQDTTLLITRNQSIKKTRSHILIHFYFNKQSKYHSHPSFLLPHSHFRHIIKQSVHHFRNLPITLSSLLSLPPSFLPSLHTTEPPNSQTPFDPLESRVQTERFGT